MRHCWGPGVKNVPPLDIGEWSDLLQGRRSFMPVRDPAEMAWSWVNTHGRVMQTLLDALEQATLIIENLPIERVDIRALTVNYRRGDHQRDEATGEMLARNYPAYFGGIYDGG